MYYLVGCTTLQTIIISYYVLLYMMYYYTIRQGRTLSLLTLSNSLNTSTVSMIYRQIYWSRTPKLEKFFIHQKCLNVVVSFNQSSDPLFFLYGSQKLNSQFSNYICSFFIQNTDEMTKIIQGYICPNVEWFHRLYQKQYVAAIKAAIVCKQLLTGQKTCRRLSTPTQAW